MLTDFNDMKREIKYSDPKLYEKYQVYVRKFFYLIHKFLELDIRSCTLSFRYYLGRFQ